MGYTNSPLVAYTKISPNRTKNRNHAIDTITIHCVVGQCSVESLGEVFAPESRQASSNYGVGVDGRIGMYCEEKDRSWCSSNAANDHRAITIEVASDTAHPYAVNEKAYAALIDLCVDICQRNGIKKLVWSTNKDERVNHLNGCNMTVHRDYANKSCPGDYLYERHGAIANAVNARLGVTETVVAEDSEATIWKYLHGKLGNAYGTAGIMGNLFAESGLKPTNLQNAYEKKLGYTDTAYTAAVDDGTYDNFVRDSAGYGLAQWTYWSRKQGLLDLAKAEGKSVGDLGLQLDYIWKELTEGYGKLLKTLQTATGVADASTAVLTQYERPADQGEAVRAKRAVYGQTYYDKYAPKPTHPERLSSGYYRVRKAWKDKKSQLGAYRLLSNAKAKADKNPGYFVFTEDGTAIYPTEASEPTEEGYAVHTVVAGDTLWKISEKYLGKGIRYPEIKKLNGLTSDTIYRGMKLKIPR